MLFNSIQYAIFFPIVFALYWLLARIGRQWQNVMLLGASYYFYGSWDIRFLGLLAFSTLLDYYCGIRIGTQIHPLKRKVWLWISLVINLGFLAVFKYYDFFASSMQVLLRDLGWEVPLRTLGVILPVGISFYTFHGISYIIDIYNRRIPIEKNWIDYALFVSFFPLLVAGPIERATHLLPQLKKERTFRSKEAAEGLRQILWGLFKKMVIADNCGRYVNYAFDGTDTYSAGSYWLSAVFFTIQIYCDFSGYTDIALGSARLLGIELLQNFSYPLFARSIGELWKRWHISLTTWFRDYLYIPLGGNRLGLRKTIRNVLIVFVVSGLWHGANWTFLIWGFLHGLLFVVENFVFKRKESENPASTTLVRKLRATFQLIRTFSWTTLAFIFFRSETIEKAFEYFKKMIPIGDPVVLNLPETENLWKIIPLTLMMFSVEWWGRNYSFALEKLDQRMPASLRYCIYYSLIFLILYFSSKPLKFVYFQF